MRRPILASVFPLVHIGSTRDVFRYVLAVHFILRCVLTCALSNGSKARAPAPYAAVVSLGLVADRIGLPPLLVQAARTLRVPAPARTASPHLETWSSTRRMKMTEVRPSTLHPYRQRRHRTLLTNTDLRGGEIEYASAVRIHGFSRILV